MADSKKVEKFWVDAKNKHLRQHLLKPVQNTLKTYDERFIKELIPEVLNKWSKHNFGKLSNPAYYDDTIYNDVDRALRYRLLGPKGSGPDYEVDEGVSAQFKPSTFEKLGLLPFENKGPNKYQHNIFRPPSTFRDFKPSGKYDYRKSAEKALISHMIHEGQHAKDYAEADKLPSMYDRNKKIKELFPNHDAYLKGSHDDYVMQPGETRAMIRELVSSMRDENISPALWRNWDELRRLVANKYRGHNANRIISNINKAGDFDDDNWVYDNDDGEAFAIYAGKSAEDKKKELMELMHQFHQEGPIKDIPSDIRFKRVFIKPKVNSNIVKGLQQWQKS